MFGERFTRATQLATALVGQMDHCDRFSVMTCDSECKALGDLRAPSATAARRARHVARGADAGRRQRCRRLGARGDRGVADQWRSRALGDVRRRWLRDDRVSQGRRCRARARADDRQRASVDDRHRRGLRRGAARGGRARWRRATSRGSPARPCRHDAGARRARAPPYGSGADAARRSTCRRVSPTARRACCRRFGPAKKS